MPPRYQSRPTDLLTRVRNEMDALGRPGMAGTSRLGSNRGRGGRGQSAVADAGGRDQADGEQSAQLLVLSVTADSVASGGDHVAFDTVVAQHGFDGVAQPSGGAWVHPVSGVYWLGFEMAWDTFTGGGTVRVELDGTLIPEGVILDGTDGQEGQASLAYVAEAGQVGKIHVSSGDASAQTCDAVVRIAITDPKVVTPAPAAGDVVCIADYGESPWASVPTGWNDPDACWIWHTALDGSGGRPDYEEAWFEGTHESLSATAVTVEFTADNLCSVSLNGTLLGSDSDHTNAATSVAATLNAGANVLEVYAQNTTRSGGGAHPAGFLLTVIRDSDGTILFRTTDAGGWFGFTSEPAGWTGP